MCKSFTKFYLNDIKYITSVESILIVSSRRYQVIMEYLIYFIKNLNSNSSKLHYVYLKNKLVSKLCWVNNKYLTIGV